MVERLEAVLGRLPEAIQKPLRHELTPLKQLFLQQRNPRFLLAGSERLPLPQIVNVLFNAEPAANSRQTLFEIFRWQTLEVRDRGTVSVLDARAADEAAEEAVRQELKRGAADVVLIVSDASEGPLKAQRSGENAQDCVRWHDALYPGTGIAAIHFEPERTPGHDGNIKATHWSEKIPPQLHGRVWGGFEFSGEPAHVAADRVVSEQFVSVLAKRL